MSTSPFCPLTSLQSPFPSLLSHHLSLSRAVFVLRPLLSSSLQICSFLFSVMSGSHLPRPIPGVYERDAGRQASGVYPGGTCRRQGLVRLLWHEHVHHQPMQSVLLLSAHVLRALTLPSPLLQRQAVKTSSKAMLNTRSRDLMALSLARKVRDRPAFAWFHRANGPITSTLRLATRL